jgi:hypothetical protein
MIIFYLDTNPLIAARYHADTHVVKMILESIQIISTVAWKYGVPAPYKPTHKNHPSVIWAGKSIEHVSWLFSLANHLDDEYLYRYAKVNSHRSFVRLCESYTVSGLKGVLPDSPLIDPPQVMPDEFKQADTVQAYRDYYAIGKQHLHKWTNRETPEWIRQ